MNSLAEALISVESAHKFVDQIEKANLIDSRDTLLIIYDFDVFHGRINTVKNAFPDYWKHAIAIKSNPITRILTEATEKGFGLEAASFEELLQAQICKSSFIVWDSPVKTQHEMLGAMTSPSTLFINANSLEEFSNLCFEYSPLHASKHIGIRINPELNSSANTSMRVGDSYSKFGEPISNNAAIVQALKNAPGKVGLHVHSSSQNLQTDETIQAIKKVYDLANEVGWNKINYFDIGGGYPVDYGFTPVASIARFSEALKKVAPKLFDGSVSVITEFGRYYHANAGWTISQVNEVKHFNTHQTVIQHAGADLFLRECYEAGKWPHRISIRSKSGLSEDAEYTTDIGGPLCFGGDYIAKGLRLTKVQKGDWLLILDTGANSFALWSKHCSRPFPKVIGAAEGRVFMIKDRQSSEDAIALWS